MDTANRCEAVSDLITCAVSLPNDTIIDISSFNVTFYGKQYSLAYVNITGDNVTVCFNGYHGTAEGLDCIITKNNTTPTPAYFIAGPTPLETTIHNSLKSVTQKMTGSLYLFIVSTAQCVTYKTGDVISHDADTCSYLICSEVDVYTTRPNNGTPAPVSGPAVIDISGRVNSVQDRCAHSLMLLPSAPNFHVLANFQERRRKDLNDTTLTLNSSVLEVHGVELSKDHTGVPAKVVLTDYNTSVSLTATPHTSASQLPDFMLLFCLFPCGDSCNLLNEAPFTACHNHTDPAPYITACTDTLCKYPAVDRLSCQFLEAYAKACRLYSNITLEDWRSNAGCSAPRAPCQDRFCNAHEFCAEKASGEDGCFCRALFASPYRSTGTLGTTAEKGIDYSTMHLNDNSCAGQMDEQTHMVTFSFSDSNFCGTVVSVGSLLRALSSSTLLSSLLQFGIFLSTTARSSTRNTIMTHNHTDVIVRHDQVSIDFSCFYTQPDIRTMAFRIKDSSVDRGDHIWSLELHSDHEGLPGLQPPRLVESSTEITLNQKIWVQLETDGLGDGLVAVVTDCVLGNQPGIDQWEHETTI
ncbi:hypothetical protein GBF38_004897 [Nibea albiflora]|uniref:Uncharacterized protein n=1 Tax=Nibea albiflora TaxID=240163 RepID=A0ACB7EVT4_NIBAL|nr:hypothetical protein GBF38_004897 [Nibea albiflora]